MHTHAAAHSPGTRYDVPSCGRDGLKEKGDAGLRESAA